MLVPAIRDAHVDEARRALVVVRRRFPGLELVEALSDRESLRGKDLEGHGAHRLHLGTQFSLGDG